MTTHRTQAGFTSDRQLAVRMGVDHSTMHRVLTRKSEPSNGFIAAALEALPEATFEDLFEH